MRQAGADGEEQKISEDLGIQKKLDDYGEKIFAKNSEIFSSWHPDVIEGMLVKFLENNENCINKKTIINKDKYKIKFTLTAQG